MKGGLYDKEADSRTEGKNKHDLNVVDLAFRGCRHTRAFKRDRLIRGDKNRLSTPAHKAGYKTTDIQQKTAV